MDTRGTLLLIGFVFSDGRALHLQQRKWVNDTCIIRYLRAKHLDVDAAIKMLDATLQWRSSYLLQMTWNQISPMLRVAPSLVYIMDRPRCSVPCCRQSRPMTDACTVCVAARAFSLTLEQRRGWARTSRCACLLLRRNSSPLVQLKLVLWTMEMALSLQCNERHLIWMVDFEGADPQGAHPPHVCVRVCVVFSSCVHIYYMG